MIPAIISVSIIGLTYEVSKDPNGDVFSFVVESMFGERMMFTLSNDNKTRWYVDSIKELEHPSIGDFEFIFKGIKICVRNNKITVSKE